jgi:osmotically-inducible protein OsmY
MNANRRLAITTSLTAVALTAAGCASPPEPLTHLVVGNIDGPEASVAFVTATPRRLDDSEMANLAKSEIRRAIGPHADALEVSYEDGTLTLRGELRSLALQDAALAAAARLRNVETIADGITLDIPNVDDALITKRIEKRLAATPGSEPWDVGVEVDDGEVILRGRVDSMQEQRLAIEMARLTTGVRSVDNEMFYEPTPRNDEEIAEDVEMALRFDLFLSHDPISVDVDDGRVTLSGDVRSLAERQRAAELAWVAGVKDVHAKAIKVHFDGPRPGFRRVPVPMPDQGAAKAIELSLSFDPRVPTKSVNVRVEDGTVVLTGVVSSYAAKQAAEDAASQSRVAAVVDNRIEVEPQKHFEDAYLTQAVQEALADESIVDATDVSVEVVGGEATLRGELDSVAERKAAVRAASEVAGITEVADELETKQFFAPGLRTPDRSIARAVETALLNDPLVSGANLVVTVDDDVITLTGIVDGELARRRAIEDAHDTGARAVHDRLIVAAPGGSSATARTTDS